MSYKIKSLLYFTCLFAVSVAYYHSEKNTDSEPITIAQTESVFANTTP